MVKRWLLVGVWLLVLVIPAARVEPAQTNRAQQLVAEVNAYRAAHGLPSLEVHPSLTVAAQTHVEWMARNYTYSHTGEGGTTPPQRAAAAGYPTNGWYVFENVVGGTTLTPVEAVGWWDRSPVHQQTMLLQGYKHIGAGYAENDEQQLYVLMVAKPSGAGGTAGGDDSGGTGNADDDAGDDNGGNDTPGGEPPTAAPVVMVPVVKSEPGPDGSIVHEVKQGQTAWTIAAVYGVDLMDIVSINHLGPDAIVKPGDLIIVRLGEGQAPPPAPTTHTVQEGETAWTIAALYGLTLDELLALNGIDRSTLLYPGDEVLIRDPDPTATPTPIPTNTPTPAAIPTRSDVTLAPTWTLSPTWSPTPDVPTRTPTAALPPTDRAPAEDDGGNGGGPDRALLVSVGVAGAGLMILAGGAVLARWRRGAR
jgi:LysM repeat protein